MKFLGAILIIGSFSLIGYNFSNRLNQKCKITQQLILMAELIKVKISCNLDETTKIIKKLSTYDSLNELTFLKSINTDETTFSNSFKESVINAKLPLNDDDIELIISLGNGLGTTDCEGQIGMIDSFINQIKKSLETYSEDKKRLSKLYVSFGFFGGIATSILIL